MFFSARHAVALAAVALFGFSAPAAAAEAVTLKFATQNTENAWTTVHGIKPWIEQIEKDSNGSIKIDFYANQTLTKGNQAWQAVRKGIADMSWVTMGSYPGMNLLMEIINQPGMLQGGQMMGERGSGDGEMLQKLSGGQRACPQKRQDLSSRRV